MSDDATTRLRDYPPKIARPLQELVKHGQLSNSALHNVLNVVEITGEPYKALGFAVAYCHMRMEGIQIDDTVRMAKELGRRVNLSWGPARWREEHNKLGRLAVAKRLSDENVTYDVTKFEAMLPDEYPGYIIRNSRQLGREGLRQEHCVASGTYHSMCMSGHCAFVTLFVNQKRWTVQIALAGEPRIMQVKGKLNANPSAAERDQIYEALGFAQPEPISVIQGHNPTIVGRDAGEPSYMVNLRQVLPILRENGVQEVHINFSGEGDSGSIDGASYMPYRDLDQTAINRLRVPNMLRVTQQHNPDTGRWETVYERDAELRMGEALEGIADDFVDITNVDWYNNDGGYGSLEINVAAGTCKLEVWQRRVESECEWQGEYNIETGEQIDD